MQKKIRAVVVDDSAFIRKSLSIMLDSSNEIEVIATANDGIEAVKVVKELVPDIVTLDIEMPRMNGLEALKIIMRDCPVPVLMISSLTTEGAMETMKALSLGAVDFIPKESVASNSYIIQMRQELVAKIKQIVLQKSLAIRLKRLTSSNSKYINSSIFAKDEFLTNKKFNAISIGVSTGGPLSLQKIVPQISEQLSIPIFIVQHMPAMFTKSLASRLNDLSSVHVKEAEDGELVNKSTVYLAPGGKQMIIAKTSFNQEAIKITDEPEHSIYKPSVDITINSLTDLYGAQHLPIIMTGMGRDGAAAVSRVKKMGGHSIAQDEDSSVVYGMPKAIVDAGDADIISPLDKIANYINRTFQKEISHAGTFVSKY